MRRGSLMKIVIACNAFKGSLTSGEANAAVRRGLARVWPGADFLEVPMADGGDGTLDCLVAATGGSTRTVMVSDPLGRLRPARLGLSPDGVTGFIEMAEASGLRLLGEDERDPLRASSRGTGELIMRAVESGCRRLVVGIGGSATVDGGAGLLQALGARLLDEHGTEIGPGALGLERLATLDLSAAQGLLDSVELLVASDVTNPLLGEEGAAAVYGPQKGAGPEEVPRLERALARLARLAEESLGRAIHQIPGAGAAGGVGAALAGILPGRLVPGAQLIMETIDFPRLLQGAALCLTGEGRLDGQSIYGKVPVAVARAASAAGIPALLLAGSLGPGWELAYQNGVSAVLVVVSGPTPLERALAQGAANLERTAEALARLVKVGGSLGQAFN